MQTAIQFFDDALCVQLAPESVEVQIYPPYTHAIRFVPVLFPEISDQLRDVALCVQLVPVSVDV